MGENIPDLEKNQPRLPPRKPEKRDKQRLGRITQRSLSCQSAVLDNDEHIYQQPAKEKYLWQVTPGAPERDDNGFGTQGLMEKCASFGTQQVENMSDLGEYAYRGA